MVHRFASLDGPDGLVASPGGIVHRSLDYDPRLGNPEQASIW